MKTWRVRRLFWRTLLALAATILLANILFWVLVGVQFSPVQDRYEDGRIIRLGKIALVFGHGEWLRDEGVEEHYTTAFLRRGVKIKRPTLEVVQGLRSEGVRWVWGTWCYSGDHEFIRIDRDTGEETPWPSYVSRNRRPGKTLPVWLGVGFLRLSVGSRHKERFARPEDSETGESSVLGIEVFQQTPFFSEMVTRTRYFYTPPFRS